MPEGVSTGCRGKERRASRVDAGDRGAGSGGAVARVVEGAGEGGERGAARAARVMGENQGWRAPEVKAAILERARALPEDGQSVVHHGWSADPSGDG